MGKALSVARSNIENEKREEMEKSLRMLDFMETMLKSKMESFTNSLKHPSDDTHQVLLGTIVDQVTEYTLNATETSASEVVNRVIDHFLSKDIISGFKEVITYAVHAILNNETIGESYRQEYYLLIEHNALVRIDILFYKYEFGSSGITDQLQNIFCYMFYKSVIPTNKLDHNLLIYTISKYFNNTSEHQPHNETIKKYIKEWKDFRKDLEADDNDKEGTKSDKNNKQDNKSIDYKNN
ncbi:12915_t:CDS:2 [Cetraspora pellucida]|uniref:12915_t:CDS:1 n=1 Tax=Cetraspora pellucida TaxID=1433469 RepID=A0ACA9M7D6_9GLOM|nr:12915_t:CDS:2 [Cetraspora pellucida]